MDGIVSGVTMPSLRTEGAWGAASIYAVSLQPGVPMPSPSLRFLALLICVNVLIGCATPRSATPPASLAPGAVERSAERQRTLNRHLIVAALKGDAGEVERLLAAGAWGDARFGGTDNDRQVLAGKRGGLPYIGSEHWTALHAVAIGDGDGDEVERVRVAKLLLDAGAWPDAQDDHGATPLYTAIKSKREALALLLIERGADVNTTTSVYIDATEGTPLHLAAEQANPRLMRALLAAGAEVEAQDSWDFMPLHDAVGARSVECARLLIDAGADVNAGGWIEQNVTPLISACGAFSKWDAARKGETNAEMARLLIAAGADVNARAEVHDPFEPTEVDIMTPLLEAADHEDLATVRVLVAAGADVRVVDEEGRTPLHMIADGLGDLRDIEDGLRLLLEAGADPAAKDKEGKAALDLGPELFGNESPAKAAAVRRVRALLDPTRPPKRKSATAPPQPAPAPPPARP